ncbi:hypothetical protein ACOME3_005037 [Neoechinorhynchus agilis]
MKRKASCDRSLVEHLRDDSFRQKLIKSIHARRQERCKVPKILFKHELLKGLEGQEGNIDDVRRMILHAAVPTEAYLPRWCAFLRKKYLQAVRVIVVNGIDGSILQKSEQINELSSLFGEGQRCEPYIQFKSDTNNRFLDSLLEADSLRSAVMVPLSLTNWKRSRGAMRQQMKEAVERLMLTKEQKIKADLSPGCERFDLLLSLNQMIDYQFNLPLDKNHPGYKPHQADQFRHTKDQYKPVTNASPLLSIDCEMCVLRSGEFAAVWLAVINEQLECIYETYVYQAPETVRSYNSMISGVNAYTLRECVVTLKHVQDNLCSLLTEDTILVGHSISVDLKVLKLWH